RRAHGRGLQAGRRGGGARRVHARGARRRPGVLGRLRAPPGRREAVRLLRYLLLLPRLVEAIAYAGLIMIATPLLAVLDGRRRSHRGPAMTDAEDIPENTPTENRLLAAAEALDAAGIPRAGETLGLELDLPERIQRLARERDDK